MGTFVGNIKDHQIILVGAVSQPHPTSSTPIPFDALLDTGAQATLITEKVVKDVGLVSIGTGRIIPVSGKVIETNKYRIRLDIPIGDEIVLPSGQRRMEPVLRGMELDVSQLPYQPQNHDILLGMDFINACHLTVHGGNYILSI